MEDFAGVKKLVEFIFVNDLEVTAEMKEHDSSFPICLLIDDFPRKLHQVLLARQLVIASKWPFNNKSSELLSSLDIYFAFTISACLEEHKCQANVFDSFIAVCTCVKYFSNGMLHYTGVNLGDLNFDIVMEFYNVHLMKSFLKCGGFRRLVEYIHDHKYLKWNLDKFDPASFNDDLDEKLDKVLSEERKTLESLKLDMVALNTAAIMMTWKILATTSVQLPTLTSDLNSDETVSASNRNETAKAAEKKRTTESTLKFQPLEQVRPACSNSNSKTNHDTKQKVDIAWYKSIVQAVINYNNSKKSGLVSSGNQCLKKADGILKHLKDTIQSLIDVLDEYDEE